MTCPLVIVIQKNKNDRTNFNWKWRDYEDGFGKLDGAFWAGLKLMHLLTQTGDWELRVDYQRGYWSYIHYNQFKVGSASENYRLTVGGTLE